MKDDEIIAAGRSMMDDLPGLLGASAPGVQAALGKALARADAGQPQAAEGVLDLLAGHAATREELARRLPGQEDTVRAAYPGGLPGLPAGASAQVRRCTTCGYEYPVFEAGEPVPDCPRGHGPLV